MSKSTSLPIPLAGAMLVDVPPPTSDAPGSARALTEAIARGDENAFNRFYSEYSPRVFRLLLVVTGGEEDLSRELHQCVMIQAARKLKALHSEAELWAWLAQVARNKWKDALRKRNREARAYESSLQLASRGVPPEWAAPLREAIAALDEPERRLLESFYFDDLPQKEMARNFGRSVKAIQCALARIRKKLKEIIKDS